MILELWMVGVAIAFLLLIRVPVGLAFIGPCLWWSLADGSSSGFALKTTFDGLNSFPLLAVPLFILVGVWPIGSASPTGSTSSAWPRSVGSGEISRTSMSLRRSASPG